MQMITRLAVAAATATLATPAASAAPIQLTYQVRMLNSQGDAVNSTEDVLIELFATEGAASPEWFHTFNEDIQDGYVAIVLGGSPPLDLDDFTGGEIWVQATVDNTEIGARQRLLSVPYALVARSVMADATPSAPCDVGSVQWDTSTSKLLVCNGATWDTLATADNSGGPVGTVISYAGGSVPTGWIACDGASVSRTTYSDLFAAIGTAYGTGDGSTTFNVPDLRGQFLRGVDDMGTAAGAGGVDSGRTLGSTQADELAGHTHAHSLSISSSGSHHHGLSGGHSSNHNDYFAGSNNAYGIHTSYTSSASQYGSATSDTSHTHPNSSFGGSITSAGGDETRPTNVAVTYLIRH